MKEVTTMTTSTFGTTSNTTTIHGNGMHGNRTVARRPAIDVAVERLARSLLAWSARRAKKNELTGERMALIIANERSAPHGGSQIGR
jgi:hypothetical protein